MAMATALLGACSSKSAATSSPAGAEGPVDAGPTVISISATAQQGIDISPVPLQLDGLTGAQLEQVGQGSYLVNAIGDCTGCHTADPMMFLAGGVPFGGAGTPFTVLSRNLTPDPTTGLPANLHDVTAFVSAMQTGADYHGVADGGTPTQSLVVMPWASFRWLAPSDIQAIYSYLTVIPPVKNAIAVDTKMTGPPTPLPSAYADGDQTTPPALPPVADQDPDSVLRGAAINPLGGVPPPSDPVDMALFGRGSYLVNALADCGGCHTNPATTSPTSTKVNTAAFLTGGEEFDTPVPLQPMLGTVRAVSADLTGQTNGFFNNPVVTFETFLTLITQGIHAEDPHPARVAFPMPWQVFSQMQLGDLQAIYEYLNRVAVMYGQTRLTGAADKNIPNPALYCDATHACATGTCSSETGPGECLASPCTTATVDDVCTACETCSAATAGTCEPPAAGGPTCSY